MERTFLITLFNLAFSFLICAQPDDSLALMTPQAEYNGHIVSVTQQFPAGRIYTDTAGNRFIECKMLVTTEGTLIPEKGSPLEGYILIPTQRVNLTASDIQDIYIFINYRDLKNRIKKE